MKQQLAAGCNPNQVYARAGFADTPSSGQSQTALHRACQKHFVKIAIALLDAKADPNISSDYFRFSRMGSGGRTTYPLYKAVKYWGDESPELVRRLLQAKASKYRENLRYVDNEMGPGGRFDSKSTAWDAARGNSEKMAVLKER